LAGAVGLVGVAAATMYACKPHDLSKDAPSTIAVAYSEDFVDEAWDSEPRFLVFLPLVGHDEHGEAEGCLARAWEHSPDYRETTYHLRTDVRWHDGTPVTARDVKFTLWLMTRPEVGEMSPESIEVVTVVDDSTVSVRGTSDWDDQWTVILPAHLLEGLEPTDLREWDFWRQPVGSGPYRFVRYIPQVLMEFEANPDHHRGKPMIERVTLKFVEGALPLTELLSGNVDAAPGTSPAQVRTLAADSRFEVYRSISVNEARVIYWQTDHPILGDPRVRRALTLAIDRRSLLRLLYFPDDGPLVDGPVTARQMRRGDLPKQLPHDPDAARKLLEAAGWIDEDGDAVRERDGSELRFTAIVRGYFAQPGWDDLLIHVQDQLRRIGVQMEIQVLDRGIVSQRRRSGDFEALFSWYNSRNLWFRPPTGFFQRLAGLLDSAEVALDPDVRDRVYGELADVFREEVPLTFLFPDVWTWVVHRRIRGLSGPWRVDPLAHMEHLWLEDAP
jgi:peptide/nickel transport system substrate-binding protein